MAKLTVEQLINTATELNDVMGFNEEDAPPVEGTKEELQAWVKEAAEELQPPDEISKESQIVLQALDVWVNQEDRKDLDADEEDETAPEAETETETDGPDLVKKLDETETLKDLKTMVKANDEFKSLRGSITKYKAGEEEELKEAMFVLLEPVEEEEKPETKEIKMTPSGKEEVPIPKKSDAKKEKEVPVKVKKTGKVDPSKSNKAIVYLTWVDGEKDVEKLHKQVNENVKLSTIKSWLNQWKTEKNLPAVAKE